MANISFRPKGIKSGCSVLTSVAWISRSHELLGMGSANERRRYIVTTSLIGWARTHELHCMGSANERRRYIVTTSLIGWARTQNVHWMYVPTTPDTQPSNKPSVLKKKWYSLLHLYFPFTHLKQCWLSSDNAPHVASDIALIVWRLGDNAFENRRYNVAQFPGFNWNYIGPVTGPIGSYLRYR